jgi:hypothetical protein
VVKSEEIEEQVSLYNIMRIKMHGDDIFIPTLGYDNKEMAHFVYANKCRIYPKKGCP